MKKIPYDIARIFDVPYEEQLPQTILSVCPTYVGMNRIGDALSLCAISVCPTYVGMNR